METALGKREKTNRDGLVAYVDEEIFGVKWRDWKMLTKVLDDSKGTGKIVKLGFAHFYDLSQLPKKCIRGTPDEAGTPNPYTPAKKP